MNAVAPLQMATGLLHLLSDVAILYGEAARERIMTVIEKDIASDAEKLGARELRYQSLQKG